MLLEIVLLLLAFPIGYLISYLARDELLDGRKWFKMLIALSVVAGLLVLVNQDYSAALTSLFIIVISSVSLWKSNDKTWTKNRFQ